MPQSLKDKTVKGVAWSSIDDVVQFGVNRNISIPAANRARTLYNKCAR